MAEHMQGQMSENSGMLDFHSNAEYNLFCQRLGVKYNWMVTLKYSTSKLFSTLQASSMMLQYVKYEDVGLYRALCVCYAYNHEYSFITTLS